MTDVKVSKVESLEAPATDLPVANPVQETLAALGSPVDPRHIRQRKQGKQQVDYLPWPCIVRHLNFRAPGWTWTIDEISSVGSFLYVKGTLTVPCGTNSLVFSGVSSERLDAEGFAPPIESCCSRALARAAALTGFSLALWEQ